MAEAVDAEALARCAREKGRVNVYGTLPPPVKCFVDIETRRLDGDRYSFKTTVECPPFKREETEEISYDELVARLREAERILRPEDIERALWIWKCTQES